MVDNITYVFTNVTSPTTMEFTPTGILYAVIFTILMMLFILIPYIWDLRNSYALAKERDERAQSILEKCIPDIIARIKSQNNQMTDDEIGKICDKIVVPVQETLKQPVTGITGFTRGMIAMAIIFLIGISVLLIMFANRGDPQIINNIISMLGTTLAAIAGFYFGGKIAIESREGSETSQTSSPAALVSYPHPGTPSPQPAPTLKLPPERTKEWQEIIALDNERRLIEERIRIRAKRHHMGYEKLTEEEKGKLLDKNGNEIDANVDSSRYVQIENKEWDLMGVHTDNKRESIPS
jgi:hypothetical protein